jgi:signal transduction histidine kinase
LVFTVGKAGAQTVLPKVYQPDENIVAKELESLINKVKANYSTKNYKAADSLANILIKRSAKVESRYYKGRGHLLLGKSKLTQNDDKNAFVNLLEASRIFYLINDYRYLAESEMYRGILFNKAKLYEKAYNSLMTADSIFLQINFKPDLTLLYSNLGKAAFNLKKYNEALLYYGLWRKYAVMYQKWDEQIEAIKSLALTYRITKDYNSAIQYDLELVNHTKRINSKEYPHALLLLAEDYYSAGDYKTAKKTYNLVLQNNPGNKDLIRSYLQLTEIAMKNGDEDKAVEYLNKAWKAAGNINRKAEIINKLTKLYIKNKKYDEAAGYNDAALESVNSLNDKNKLKTYNLAQKIALARKDYKNAFIYSQKSAAITDSLLAKAEKNSADLQKLNNKINDYEIDRQYDFIKDNLVELNLENKELEKQAMQKEVELLRAERKRKQTEEENLKLRLKKARTESMLYRQQLQNRENEAKIASMQRRDTISKLIIARDSIQRINHERELEAVENQKKLSELQADKLRKRNIYLFIILLISLISLIGFLRSLKIAKKNNRLLQEKNETIEKERKKLEEALQKLKEAQSKLIETERLATLGQITAGIAHEIRNPLNFVNNFAKLSKQYAEEIEEMIKRENLGLNEETKEEFLELAGYLRDNSAKIMEHGDRAARIIARMLETARNDHAVKEPTDLNLLIEDSVKLAYQGVRGDYPDFTAQLNFNFDPNIRKVNIVAQDMGRVFINLINNACHAIIDKKEKQGDYEGRIDISTKLSGNKIEIVVKDNGTGIGKEALTNLFKPFYTTKKAGKGTGLGLTMSKQIIDKVHGGDIKVESVENEYTKFIITLPKN